MDEPVENIRFISVPGYLSDLSNSLYQLQQDGFHCDVQLLGENGDVRAHSIILSAASPYFRQCIVNSTCNGLKTIFLKGEEVQNIQNLITLVYTGSALLSVTGIVKLFRLLKNVEMESLTKYFYEEILTEGEKFNEANFNPEQNSRQDVDQNHVENFDDPSNPETVSFKKDDDIDDQIYKAVQRIKTLEKCQDFEMQESVNSDLNTNTENSERLLHLKIPCSVPSYDESMVYNPCTNVNSKRTISEEDNEKGDNFKEEPVGNQERCEMESSQNSVINKVGLKTPGSKKFCKLCDIKFVSEKEYFRHRKYIHFSFKGATSAQQRKQKLNTNLETAENAESSLHLRVPCSLRSDEQVVSDPYTNITSKRLSLQSKEKGDNSEENSVGNQERCETESSKVTLFNKAGSKKPGSKKLCKLCNIKFISEKEYYWHRKCVHFSFKGTPSKQQKNQEKISIQNTKKYEKIQKVITEEDGNNKISVENTERNQIKDEVIKDEDIESDGNSFNSGTDGSEMEDEIKTKCVKQRKVLRKTCIRCKIKFESNEAFLKHKEEFHKNWQSDYSKMYNSKMVTYKCSYEHCSYKSKRIRLFIRHKYIEHGEEFDENKYPVLRCDVEGCNYIHFHKSRIIGHKAEAHSIGGTILVCQTCGKQCKTMKNLKIHEQTHIPMENREMKAKCPLCNKRFQNGAKLNQHLNFVHDKTRKNLCHLCPYASRTRRELQTHLLLVHQIPLPEGRQIYRCTMCDYFTVYSSTILKKHMAQHAGEKNFVCEICNKDFACEQSLKQHLRRHNLKKVNCPYEGCTYSGKNYILQRHIKAMHINKDLKPFACHLCEYRCNVQGNLTKHLRGKHKLDIETKSTLWDKIFETGQGYDTVAYQNRLHQVQKIERQSVDQM